MTLIPAWRTTTSPFPCHLAPDQINCLVRACYDFTGINTKNLCNSTVQCKNIFPCFFAQYKSKARKPPNSFSVEIEKKKKNYGKLLNSFNVTTHNSQH